LTYIIFDKFPQNDEKSAMMGQSLGLDTIIDCEMPCNGWITLPIITGMNIECTKVVDCVDLINLVIDVEWLIHKWHA
jgi:hypothetical protein